MNTSSFLTALRAHSHLPLVFRAGGEIVNPGYHLTEVKRVAYETMDCGAMLHRWTETQLEVWVPPTSASGARGHMPAEKFLKIIDRVAAELPLEGDALARVHASFAGQPAALYDIAAVEARAGILRIELTPDRTRCKAAERQRDAAASGCGTTAAEPEKTETASGCGCGTNKADPAVACCA